MANKKPFQAMLFGAVFMLALMAAVVFGLAAILFASLWIAQYFGLDAGLGIGGAIIFIILVGGALLGLSIEYDERSPSN